MGARRANYFAVYGRGSTCRNAVRTAVGREIHGKDGAAKSIPA